MVHRKPSSPRRGVDRLTVLTVLVLLFVCAIVARLFLLQVINHGFYVALAEGQHVITEKLMPLRGSMYARDPSSSEELLPLAINRELRLVYAIPKQVSNPEETAQQLAELLQLDPVSVFDRLNRPNDGYEPIKHEVPLVLAEQIDALQLSGIQTSPEMTRFYPSGDITSHLTGFVGFQNDKRVGQYGLEGYFEKMLAGEPGLLESESDSLGRLIAVGNRALKEARNGDSLVLTVDRTVQYTVCKKLEAAVEKHGADGGSVIIVNPSTGAIIAMCNVPNFDANRYQSVKDILVYANKAIFDQYEPGSVMKTMTLASAINEGLITPETEYDDPGSVKIGNYTIRNSDYKEYGRQKMTDVLEQSINTGAIFVVRQLGAKRFYDYLKAFGFGEPTGVELQGENPGNIAPLKKEGEIWSATGSFGQGITTTPLQLVMAYASIANGGQLMRPYIVDEVVKPNGFKEKTQPKIVRRVLDQKTATTMKAMLVNVVRRGHGKRAGVPGYYIGGKTGTAQVPYPDRAGYDPSKNIGTFVGFGPMSNPQFAMVVKIDVPRDVQFAESSAAPLFGDLAAFLLKYYRISPDETTP